MATAKKKTTPKTAKKPAAKKAGAKSAKSARKTAKAPDQLKGAARRAAEMLGMDPEEVAATADKLREQGKHASKKLLDELTELQLKANEWARKFDQELKESVKKVEVVADEMAKGMGINTADLSAKWNQGVDRVSKEATKVAEETNAELKKIYELARVRLNDIVSKKKHE